MKPETFRKKEIIEITKNACDLLEMGLEDKFYDEIETLLISKIPFGKLKPMGEYLGKRGGAGNA